MKNDSTESHSTTYILKPPEEAEDKAKLSIKIVDSGPRTVKNLIGEDLALGDSLELRMDLKEHQLTLDMDSQNEEKTVDEILAAGDKPKRKSRKAKVPNKDEGDPTDN